MAEMCVGDHVWTIAELLSRFLLSLNYRSYDPFKSAAARDSCHMGSSACDSPRFRVNFPAKIGRTGRNIARDAYRTLRVPETVLYRVHRKLRRAS